MEQSTSLDGFSGAFFSTCWDIIGDSVVAATGFFLIESGKLLKAHNPFFMTPMSETSNLASLI